MMPTARHVTPNIAIALLSSHLSGRIITITLIVPAAWVDFSWELERDERDNLKKISVIIISLMVPFRRPDVFSFSKGNS